MTDDNLDADDLQPAHYFELMDRTHVAALYLERLVPALASPPRGWSPCRATGHGTVA